MAGTFSLLHTLGSDALARAVLRRLPENAVQDALLQVNIGEEPQKSGVAPSDIFNFVETLLEGGLTAENGAQLRLRGLMCLPPNCGEGELARPYFVRLRELRDGLESRFGLELPELSMGMSGDYILAARHGATMVRIGSALMGPRDYGRK